MHMYIYVYMSFEYKKIKDNHILIFFEIFRFIFNI